DSADTVPALRKRPLERHAGLLLAKLLERRPTVAVGGIHRGQPRRVPARTDRRAFDPARVGVELQRRLRGKIVGQRAGPSEQGVLRVIVVGTFTWPGRALVSEVNAMRGR